MTSRKKNKGKERKDKKAELEAEKAKLEAERIEREMGTMRKKWHGWARGDMNGQSIECNHGISLAIPDDKNHPVTDFIDGLYWYVTKNSNDLHVRKYLWDTFTTHQEVWDNKRYREMALNIFVAIGTNILLESTEIASPCGPKVLAIAIATLDNYNDEGIDSILNSRVVATKIRDISGSSNLRDALKFYRKRTTCSCLKEMHLEARKTDPKTGMCFRCTVMKERALLMVCSRCRIAQYCSRACQIAHWPMHRGHCEECVSVHEQQQATIG